MLHRFKNIIFIICVTINVVPDTIRTSSAQHASILVFVGVR